MNNSRKLFNCENNLYVNNCGNRCRKIFSPNKNICSQTGSLLDSLFCVENFLCNSQKACARYKLFCFFK